jgi:hypothetical protein
MEEFETGARCERRFDVVRALADDPLLDEVLSGNSMLLLLLSSSRVMTDASLVVSVSFGLVELRFADFFLGEESLSSAGVSSSSLELSAFARRKRNASHERSLFNQVTYTSLQYEI